MLTQNKVTLLPYTLTRCHEVYKQYVPDPMMTYDLFTYEQEKVDRYYQIKVLDKSRRFFAIQFEDKIVGEIQLKYIDENEGHGTLIILITTDAYKIEALVQLQLN